MKSKIRLSIMALLIMIGLSLESCTSDPSLANINMTMKATTSLSSITNGRLAVTGLEFTEVRVGVTELEFETLEEEEQEDNDDFEDSDNDGEDDNEEVEYEGEFIVDLIAGTSTPDFGIADLAPGIYEEMEVEMKPIMDDGNTMFVAFNYTPDGAMEPVQFEYSNKYELEFEIEDEAGFQIDEGALNQMLIIIDLDALFADIDLSNAVADEDGVVRINDTSNSAIAAAIAQNFESFMECGEDEDGDGEFDDD
jgi:hypothetical protein